jgi:undecaprenyl diphosphate synthase
MDGNGRWARQRDLPRIEGHRAGAETVRRVVEACSELGVEYLTLYAFSTENWQRPKNEVRQLMQLLRQFLKDRLKDLNKYEIRLNAIGQLERLPKLVQSELKKVIAKTQHHRKGTLTLALSYGARDEMIAATRQLAKAVAAGELNADEIDAAAISARLYTHDLPDPDLLIRTSGELRISNFMLWQLSYTELWFTDTLWPDFSADEFRAAIAEYGHRIRRYGGVTDNA